MNFELYEVWAVDEAGHEELINTTKSLKEARQIAKLNIDDTDADIDKCIIYQEDDMGDLIEIETVYAG
jgi:hypothetical protein